MHRARRDHRLRLTAAAGVVLAALSVAGAVRTSSAVAQVPCTAIQRVLSNGLATTDGSLSVTVEGTGAFASAIFNPPGPLAAAGTVKKSKVYVADGFLGCRQVEVLSESPFVTRFSVGSLSVELTQTLAPIDQRTSTLTQTYRLMNDGPATSVTVVRHVDADLKYLDDSPEDGVSAAANGSVLGQFDLGDGLPRETLVELTGSAAGSSVPSRWAIKPYDYEGSINATNGGIPAADNGVVDPGPDATLSQQWDPTAPAGGEVVFTTVTKFGTPPTQHRLDVSKTGDGTVTSAPPGIVCGTACSALYDEGTAVALAAVPDPGWSFAGWSGACSGAGACVVGMNGPRGVVAHFNPPPPLPAQNVNVAPVSGKVLVREPGTDRFVELTAADQLPIGTQVDTTQGTIQLTSARVGGLTDTSQFYEGLFTIQQAGVAALTELVLNGGDFSCIEGAFSLAKSKKPVRRLWGSGKGKFRTRGRYSAATVRGTVWKTEDRCDGTLTFVEEGIIGVRDFVRNVDVVLRTGQSYLAEGLDRSASRAGCTIIGSPGKDILRGTRKRDVICGMGGADVLLGMGGNDRLYGGAGNDWLDGGAGNDYLNGGAGRDRLDGNRGRDYLWGGKGRDLLITRDKVRGNDRVQGGSGRDLCRTDFVRVCP